VILFKILKGYKCS